jgi:hypothetical protein
MDIPVSERIELRNRWLYRLAKARFYFDDHRWASEIRMLAYTYVDYPNSFYRENIEIMVSDYERQANRVSLGYES